MISTSFEKASQWLSFRSLPRGLPSFSSGGAATLGSFLTLWPLPTLIGEEGATVLDATHLTGIIVWSPLETWVFPPQLEGVMGVGLPIGAAGWAVVAKRVAKDTFPISNCKGYMSTPRLLWDRLVKLLCMPLERMGDPTFLLHGFTFQVLHTLIQGLLQGTGMICTGGLHLPDGSCACSLFILDHGSAEGLVLLNGSFSIRYQPSLVGVHGSPSCEQPPYGHIHFPL